MATNVWATTTPAVVNGSVIPEPAVEVLADEAAPAERVEQRDAADDRRQHHRQRAQRPDQRRGPGTRPGPAARPAARRTATAASGGPQRAPQRQPQRGEGAVGGQDRPGVAPRRPPQQPDERQREEGDGDDGEDERRERAGAPARPGGGGRRPGGRRRRRSRRAEAVLGEDGLAVGAEEEVDERLVDLLVLARRPRVAMGYSATTLMSAGISTMSAASPAAMHVGDVDDAGVGLAGGHLGDDAPDVLLEADRRHRDAGRREDLVGVVAAGHLGARRSRS